MGTRGLVAVRFRGRYYIRYHRYDSYFENLGAKIVKSIPVDSEGYSGMALVFHIIIGRLTPCRVVEYHAKRVQTHTVYFGIFRL